MESGETTQSARLRSAAAAGLRAHLPPVLLLAVLYAAALVFLDETDERATGDLGLLIGHLIRLLPFFLIGCGMIGLVWLLRTPRPARPFGSVAGWVADGVWSEVLLLRIPIAIGLLFVTSHLYFTFKVNIANFAPFTWDHFFVQIDRAILLGRDPWVLSHRLLPGVWATRILDTVYLSWYLILFAVILVTAALPMRHPLRLSCMMALGLNWVIGGVILPILLPAVGPVYLERVTGDPTFVPLMELLYGQAEGTRIMALEIQEWLWDGFTRSDVEPGGIAAFPSLHVSIPATCACLGFAANRMIGWLMSVFTATVLVGSVHLGWHYAIDGLAGIVMGVLLWRISLRLSLWWLARTAPPGAGAAAEYPVVTK